jgi:hypothetical protein
MEYTLSYPGMAGFTMDLVLGRSSIGRMDISTTGILINGKEYKGKTLSLTKAGVLTIDDTVITDVPATPTPGTVTLHDTTIGLLGGRNEGLLVVGGSAIPTLPEPPSGSRRIYSGCTIGLMGDRSVNRGLIMVGGAIGDGNLVVNMGGGPVRRDLHRAKRESPFIVEEVIGEKKL